MDYLFSTEIKSLSDKRRRAIEGIFELNPKYKQIQYKFEGKHVVIFDDNLSSGATLGDVCLALQQLGIAEIIPITIESIHVTAFVAVKSFLINHYKKQR